MSNTGNGIQVQVKNKAERAGDNQANPRGARSSQQDQTEVKAEHDHTDPAAIKAADISCCACRRKHASYIGAIREKRATWRPC